MHPTRFTLNWYPFPRTSTFPDKSVALSPKRGLFINQGDRDQGLYDYRAAQYHSIKKGK